MLGITTGLRIRWNLLMRCMDDIKSGTEFSVNDKQFAQDTKKWRSLVNNIAKNMKRTKA